ncbi:MAG: cation:proton antiporter, partial [Muribaculaceae bacterium]|nr:cation:proton antiporter [Muribaculaceae bacterium]
MNINSLITDLAFILVLGAITTVLFKFLKQPVVLGYIVAGFLASPNFALLPSVTTAENIEFWAQLGIIVLLFSLGLEFSFKKLVNAGASAVGTALTIVIGMLATGFCIGKFLGFSDINCIFLGGMLSMSSTTIIIKAFTDLNLRQRKFASIVFAVLIVEDLFAVLMMVILSSIAVNNRVESSDLIYSISKLVFFLVIWFVVGIYILPSLFNATRRFLNSETLLIVSMGLCLGMAVFSVACGFSLALGAFVMGSILAGTSFAERIEHVMLSVKDLFGSIFFISVGMMVDPNVIVEYWAPILLISAAVIMGMIIFGTTGMLLTGQTLRVAIESGFSLTQIGEFAFIIATLGLSLHVLDPTIYPIVVAVSVLTTFTTPYFIRMADPTYRFIERHLPKRLQFLIERYNEKTVNRDEIKTIWKGTLKRYALRLLLYSILLVGITLISLNFFIPWLDSVLGTWGRLIGVIVTLAAMSPFLVAMTMPVANKTEREKLYGSKRGYYLRMFIMRIFRFLLAI